MFQSVISQPGLSAGRFGTGMWVSLMVHAGVFAGVLGLSGRAVEQVQKEVEVKILRSIPQPPKGNPNPPKIATPTPPKPKKPRTELVQPTKIPPPPKEPEQTAEATPPPDEPETEANDLPYVPGSDPNGVETGGVPGAIANLMLGNGVGGSTGEEVLPFGAGMTPPQILSTGVQLQYTADAARAHVSGVIIAKCNITREGDVQNCRIIRGLPFMDEAVIESLTSRHYRPVTFQGRAVSVSYTFNINLKMP